MQCCLAPPWFDWCMSVCMVVFVCNGMSCMGHCCVYAQRLALWWSILCICCGWLLSGLDLRLRTVALATKLVCVFSATYVSVRRHTF